ncbi:hypothetical protein HMPREF9078_01465 [Capnocytophaga sp. oral taxon 380 str. F0488]|nr:hypothetical protein HMPREF9078_01465 [Capnocytophaga sp. oral taxon 380 str. F0488]
MLIFSYLCPSINLNKGVENGIKCTLLSVFLGRLLLMVSKILKEYFMLKVKKMTLKIN